MLEYQTHGITVELSDRSTAAHTIATESDVIEDVLETVEPGDIFWDVGACDGTYSMIVSSVFPGSVLCVAFEPDSSNAHYLRKNINRNNSLIKIHTKCLYNTHGIVSMIESPKANHRISEESGVVKYPGEGSLTKFATLGDRIADRDGIPNVIKIDVEGAEGQVLQGLHETMESDECRAIYCEVHNRENGISVTQFGYLPSEIEDILRSYGFDVSRILDRGGNYILKAVKQ